MAQKSRIKLAVSKIELAAQKLSDANLVLKQAAAKANVSTKELVDALENLETQIAEVKRTLS